jgi:acetylornithine/N-succinyldiaminopimelate aminotransferase
MPSATTTPGNAAAADYLAPVFAQYPIEVVSAQGVWLRNSHGERVLDLYGGHAVVGLGYAHPSWTAALADQAHLCNFQTNAVAMSVRERAAERLVRFSGLPFASVFFVNSGAEANENALKIALRQSGRSHVAAVEGAFHGRTAAAGAVTWGAQASATAAVIVEPVQGLAGAVDLGAPYLEALRRRCDEVGALLIFDEVQCGMGRTGRPFAANLYGVMPDLLTTAKALGNGFPCAALLMSAAVTAGIRLESLGTTFGGGPMACAAIEAVIEAIETGDLLKRVERIGAYIRHTCITGPVTAHQGAGLLVGLRTTRAAKAIQAELLEAGILAGTSADPAVLRLLPPYILEEKHVDMLRDALHDLPQ